MISVSLIAATFLAQSPARNPPQPIMPTAAATPALPIEEIQIAPLYRASFMCSEHWQGQLKSVGDALGQDCMVTGGVDDLHGATGFPKLYRTDGKNNADWYGWGQELLAPFDGIVKRVTINPRVNQPGTLGTPPASFIIFERSDGVEVLYAHVTDVRVKPGDHVKAEQVVARVGNNGMARAPHTHVGAWRDKTPLQIRWDLRQMAELMSD